MKSLREIMNNTPHDQRSTVLHDIFDKHATDIGSTAEHNMSRPELMKSMKISGLNFNYSSDAKHAAVSTVLNLLATKMPAKMWTAQSDVYFSTQRSNMDEIRAKEYNIPNMKALATGGGGKIVVYNGSPLGAGTFAHETGHNLAHKVWGDLDPPASSAYGRAQKKESPISEYGAVHPAEDFAESVREYAENPAWLKAGSPAKYQAVRDMVGPPTAPMKPLI